MATTFYITAGLPAQDSAGSIVGDHVFYMTAGLPANDYEVTATALPVFDYYYNHMRA